MAIVRHVAINIARNAKDNRSIKLRRKIARWETAYLCYRWSKSTALAGSDGIDALGGALPGQPVFFSWEGWRFSGCRGGGFITGKPRYSNTLIYDRRQVQAPP
jgi:hypothetical protein